MDENITNKLSQLLSSPEGLANLKSMASSLGLSGNEPEEQPKPDEPDGMNFDSFLQIGKLLSGKDGKDNDTVRLLRAVKPHLSDERAEKADKAIKMLGLYNMLLVLKENGMLDGIF